MWLRKIREKLSNVLGAIAVTQFPCFGVSDRSAHRAADASLIKALIELPVERMAGRWRDLFGSDENRFRSCIAFGQSHAESSGANIAKENAPGGGYFNKPAEQPAHAR